MRVCANSNSEFYDPFYMGSQVWLDGKRIDKVIEADDENGWLIRRDFNDGYDTILRGRVSIVNPRLLPVRVPRKLTVMVMQGAIPGKFTRMLVAHWRACGHVAEVIKVTPELNGYTPEGIWVDDLEEMFNTAARASMHKVEREFLYGTGEFGSKGILSGLVATAVQADAKWPRSYRVPHERAWQTKKRKGRS